MLTKIRLKSFKRILKMSLTLSLLKKPKNNKISIKYLTMAKRFLLKITVIFIK
jgi:hypothetical protein